MKYDFKCPLCNEVAEVQASIQSGPEAPLCFAKSHNDIVPMQRLYKPLGVTYRGIGFYTTDFASEHDQFDRFYLQDKQSDQMLSVLKKTKSSASQ